MPNTAITNASTIYPAYTFDAGPLTPLRRDSPPDHEVRNDLAKTMDVAASGTEFKYVPPEIPDTLEMHAVGKSRRKPNAALAYPHGIIYDAGDLRSWSRGLPAPFAYDVSPPASLLSLRTDH